MSLAVSRVLMVAAAFTTSHCFGQAANSALRTIGFQASNFGGNSIAQINQSTLNSLVGSNAVQDGVGGNLSGTGLSTSVALDGQLRRSPKPARPASTFNIGSIGSASKPFSNSVPDSTVSPYLNLFNDSFTADPNSVPYQSIVRPQLNQQAFNQQVQTQAAVLNRRVQQVAAQPAFNPQGSERQLPTGHSTVFGNTSHFYPQPQRRR